MNPQSPVSGQGCWVTNHTTMKQLLSLYSQTDVGHLCEFLPPRLRGNHGKGEERMQKPEGREKCDQQHVHLAREHVTAMVTHTSSGQHPPASTSQHWVHSWVISQKQGGYNGARGPCWRYPQRVGYIGWRCSVYIYEKNE